MKQVSVAKGKPKTVFYRCCKKYDQNSFNEALQNKISQPDLSFDRSSRLEVFCKKSVLRNFAKFTGKHLCQSLFFNKVAG